VQIPDGSTGTGVIDSFLRVQAKDNGDKDNPLPEPFEEGFNTSKNPPPLDSKGGNFTRALLLSEIPVVNLSGTDYRQFLLDINQTGADPLISLVQFQLFQKNGDVDKSSDFSFLQVGDADQASVISITGATEIFRMSSGSANAFFDIQMDFSLNSGSGFGDIYYYVPDSAFGAGTNVILFTRFGGPGVHSTNDGFEEWAVEKDNESECTNPDGCIPQQVPETSSLLLFGTAALGILIPLRKRLTARKSA
jgi:hypothetical protein